MAPASAVVRCRGHRFLRQRLVLSLLSGRPVRIDGIRAQEDEPGLRDYEVSLLRLLERITNGTNVSISHTGTMLLFVPGTVVGGMHEHDCPTSRAVGYYLEPVVALAPFAKTPLVLTLRGITSDNRDVGVDAVRTGMLPLLRHWGVEEGIELKVAKRGAPPRGGGEVRFVCPPVKALRPVQLTEAGRIKRIRGIASSTRMSPLAVNRLINASRSLLTHFIPDVYVYADVHKGSEAGLSPGFSLSLVAESTHGVLYTAEIAAEPPSSQVAARTDPDVAGEECAKALLSAIDHGGCVDHMNMWLALLYCVLCSEDVSRVCVAKASRAGSHGGLPLSDATVHHLRSLRDFFNVSFKIHEEATHMVLSCVGVGFTNLNKKAT